MRTLLLTLLVAGVLGVTAGETANLNLLKRLLAALETEKRHFPEVKEAHIAESLGRQKRKSYGVIWTGDDTKTLKIYLLRGMNCPDPCQFVIKFSDTKGNKIGSTIERDWTEENNGIIKLTEAEILEPVVGEGSKEKEKANEGNTINKVNLKLPKDLIVQVCRLRHPSGQSCNKRMVDTSKRPESVFFETVDSEYPDPIN